MLNLIVKERGGLNKGIVTTGIKDLKNKKLKKKFPGRWITFKDKQKEDIAKVLACVVDDKKFKIRVIGKFIRVVKGTDLEKIENIQRKEKEYFRICEDLIDTHKLTMKLLKCSVSFDEKLVTFYFRAPGRVDFRGLLKDLTRKLSMFVRMQQLGPREQARIISCIGVCGQSLCCRVIATEPMGISLDDAKSQGLVGLGRRKICGACGKLMCCLKFEIDKYSKKSNKSL